MQKSTHRKGVKLSLSGYGMDTLMAWTLISMTSQSMSRPSCCDGSNLSHKLDLKQPLLASVIVLKIPQSLHVGTIFAIRILKI